MKHRDPSRETAVARSRYDRIAPFYDAVEWMMERRAAGWRQRLWGSVPGERILEVGVGTGKNLCHHPPGRRIEAIDFSPRMLERARRRQPQSASSVTFREADVQQLPYPDGSFDAAVATFVFCSVPDPLRGLAEIRRVLRPGGSLLLLEHVLSERRFLGRLMKRLDPLPVRVWGAHIGRETVRTVRGAGFVDLREEDLWLDVVKQICATAPSEA